MNIEQEINLPGSSCSSSNHPEIKHASLPFVNMQPLIFNSFDNKKGERKRKNTALIKLGTVEVVGSIPSSMEKRSSTMKSGLKKSPGTVSKQRTIEVMDLGTPDGGAGSETKFEHFRDRKIELDDFGG